MDGHDFFPHPPHQYCPHVVERLQIPTNRRLARVAGTELKGRALVGSSVTGGRTGVGDGGFLESSVQLLSTNNSLINGQLFSLEVSSAMTLDVLTMGLCKCSRLYPRGEHDNDQSLCTACMHLSTSWRQVTTGLLIAEVNINTMCELGSGGVSLVSMARRTLGSLGVQIACWSYIFIHYALLVAYVARSSDILTNYLGIPLWESASFFSLTMGGICYFCSQRVLGAINGALVVGIISSFTALVVVASGDLHWEALLKANFAAVPISLPIIALSFVYQNVVPVLCTNLEGNPSKVRTSIVLGSAIPLILFLVWTAVILGSITDQNTAEKMVDPLQQLRASSAVVGPIVETFSLLAIATSYIGFVLGLADFLADLLNLPAGQSKPLPYVLTLFPPFVLALLDPEIFFKALDFAGTYGVLVLFGILPAAMSWSDRYSTSPELPKLPELVPGGKITLSLVFCGAGWVISSQLVENLGLS